MMVSDWSDALAGSLTLMAVIAGPEIAEEVIIRDSFEYLCRKADRRAKHNARLDRLRVLLDDNISVERAYWAITRALPIPRAVVEALMFSLGERGTKALEKPDTKRRLAALSDEQAVEVGNRLLKPKLETTRAWSAEEIKILFKARIA
jgi:hypothetical protein